MQNYLVFQPVFKYFKTPTNYNIILVQKSKGLSEESITTPTLHNSLAPGMIFGGTKIRVKFGNYLNQGKIVFNHESVRSFDIVYEINLWSYNTVVYFTLGNSLFGAVKLTKNAVQLFHCQVVMYFLTI